MASALQLPTFAGPSGAAIVLPPVQVGLPQWSTLRSPFVPSPELTTGLPDASRRIRGDPPPSRSGDVMIFPDEQFASPQCRTLRPPPPITLYATTGFPDASRAMDVPYPALQQAVAGVINVMPPVQSTRSQCAIFRRLFVES